MKVKEIAKETKQKKSKKRKFPCLLVIDESNDWSQGTIVLAVSWASGVALVPSEMAGYVVGEKLVDYDFSDTEYFKMYEGELRLYN